MTGPIVALLSEDRIRRFKESAAKDRVASGVTRGIFEVAGAYQESPNVVRADLAFGIHGLLRKEPFQDRSDWAEYRTWDLALAQERYRLDGLSQRLADARNAGDVGSQWSSAFPRLVDLVHSVDADLLVVNGMVRQSLRDDIAASDLSWRTPQRGWRSRLPSTIWILGEVEGAPLLWATREGPLSAVAINVRRWGRMTAYAPARAGELLQIDLTPRDDDVDLQLYESGSFEVLDPGSAVRVTISTGTDESESIL